MADVNAWVDGLDGSNILNAESNDNVVIQFNESDGSGTFKITNADTQRLMIASDGKTAIGSITPQVLLDVNCGSANVLKGISVSDTNTSTVGLTVNNANTSYTSGILFNIYNNNRALIKANESKLLTLTTLNSVGNWNTGMNMDTTGKVGVGTTGPNYMLEVAGEVGIQVGSGYELTFFGNNDANIRHATSGYNLCLLAPSNGELHLGAGGVNSKVVIKSDGNVGIEETSPDSKLEVHGEIHATNLDGGAINLTCNASGQIIRDPSDKRLKKNIKKIEDPLEKVMKLKGVTFEWKPEAKMGEGINYGMIAQEVEKVVPELTSTSQDGTMGVRYTNAVALLVEALKEQQEQIMTLEKKLKKLEEKKSK